MSSQLLVIRHAERPMIAKGDVGNDISITENGIRATIKFARSLSARIQSIHSSPVLRCMQTARLIADVHGYTASGIHASRLLGDPGFFISDAELAWKSWLNRGCEAVNNHLLTGTETWPGFHAFDLAMANIVVHIHTLLSSNSGLIIWVTHDTILATLASRLLPSPLTLADWPDFLGALEVTLDRAGGLLLRYSATADSHSDSV